MSYKKTKLVVGFIVYNDLTAKYLSFFLPSLHAQSFTDYTIIAVDNSENKNNSNFAYLNNYYPEIIIKQLGVNIGYARAYNLIIREAAYREAKYILMINPDMIAETDLFEKLFKEMESETNLGSVSPKVKNWNFTDNKKTNIIDTCGLDLKPGLKFIDIGQSQVDNGQFDNKKILGPSGAAGFYRLSALEKIKFNGQYFDELMFMYKEDCDLAYRLYLAGYESKLVPEAIIYHDRTVAGRGENDIEIALNRKNKSRQVKKWSFLNQLIIFVKYWRRQNFLNKLALVWFFSRMLIFIVLFEPYLIREFSSLYKIKNKIFRYGL